MMRMRSWHACLRQEPSKWFLKKEPFEMSANVHEFLSLTCRRPTKTHTQTHLYKRTRTCLTRHHQHGSAHHNAAQAQHTFWHNPAQHGATKRTKQDNATQHATQATKHNIVLQRSTPQHTVTQQTPALHCTPHPSNTTQHNTQHST